MEIKPGYKQTDVGMIPEQWTSKTLGDVLSKARLGGNYANGDEDSPYPLMKMGNLDRGRFDFTKVQCVARGTRPAEEHRLAPGDVLLNTRNTLDLVGKVAIWKEELPLAFYNSNLLRLEFDSNSICSNEYACSFLNTEGSLSKLRALATGTTSVAAIYTRDLLGLPIAVPPAAEQRAIATALSDVDALIAGLERLIAKKRDIKQAAMQQLLTGQTRLPGFSGEWKLKRLGQLGTFLKGSGVKRDQALSGELPCIRYGEIYTIHSDVVRTFHSHISQQVAATATRIQEGDLLFAGSGETKTEIGKCVAIASPVEAYAGGDIVILRLRVGDPAFFGYQLNMPSVVRQKANLGQGDAVVHISASALSSVQVPVPTLEEQTAIATVLSDMDTDLAALEARLAKISTIKQGMMQELLTGRTRLV